MKLPSDPWRVRWNDDTIFYSYRWFAWVLAIISLVWPGSSGANMPRNAGLLLLLGVITLAATAMAQSYVRLARRRPIVMLLDLLAGLTIVGLSGSATLPFLPYALGALLLPALLNGWVGALLAGVLFACLDISGLLLFALPSGTAPTAMALGLRAAIPLAFACAGSLLGRCVHQRDQPNRLDPLGQTNVGPAPVAGQSPDALIRLSPFEDLNAAANLGSPRASRQPSVPTQLDPGPLGEVARPAIFDPTPSESLSFPAAFEQLTLNLGRQIGVELQLKTTGVACPLSAAQHSLLLRVAHEALLNVQQHAHAHSVQVTLTYEPQAITLAVQDDGVGLLDGTYERPGMHALRAVRYRLAEIDGQLAVFEQESGGVILRATLPLDRS